MSTFNFKNAVKDYRYLKNQGYTEKASLKLVGDRYRLSALERNCLLRGVVESSLSILRRAKRVVPGDVSGKTVGVDWFNVLITVESYLKGALLLLADDGMVRDSASIHGSYCQSPLTATAISLLRTTLSRLEPRHIDIFIDSPISHSKKIRDELEAKLLSSTAAFSFTLNLVGSADYFLKTYSGIVASSDSVIIDSARQVLDLPRLVLEENYSFHAKTIDELFTDE